MQEAQNYISIIRILELVKVVIFVISLLLLNRYLFFQYMYGYITSVFNFIFKRVVFQPLVKQILDEQIRYIMFFPLYIYFFKMLLHDRAAAMLAFLPQGDVPVVAEEEK